MRQGEAGQKDKGGEQPPLSQELSTLNSSRPRVGPSATGSRSGRVALNSEKIYMKEIERKKKGKDHNNKEQVTSRGE